jgi:hypothetical protein
LFDTGFLEPGSCYNALVPPAAIDAYDRLLVEIQAEFPRFRLIPKAESAFQKLIHNALVVITFGQMRSYLSSYQTTLGQRIYVTPSWEARSHADRYMVLCHERIHMRQFRRFTWPGMTLLYLLVPMPMGLAYFRARFEMEAYAESMRAAAELYGKAHVEEPEFREHILKQFRGASYGWMWPFPGYLARWYQREVDKL